MLVISGVARLLIPAFPTDQNGHRFQTARGTIHMILAIVIFAALIVAASKLSSTLEHRPAWHGDRVVFHRLDRARTHRPLAAVFAGPDPSVPVVVLRRR